MAYSITPYNAMGGTVGMQSIAELVSVDRSPQMRWVERLRTAIDFITPENTLICITDSPFSNSTNNATPLGLTQSFSGGEGLAAILAPEIGTRRKRAIIGSSQGGNIQISKMVVIGDSPLRTLTASGKSLGIDPNHWTEKVWMAMIGLNHDNVRTPIGLAVIEATPDGRNYSAYMYEQCVIQGQSRSYAAGQHIIVENISMAYEQIVPLWSLGASDIIDYVTSL